MSGFVYGHASTPFLSIALFYINGFVGSLFLMSMGRICSEQTWMSLPAKCAISIVGLQFIPLTIWHKLIGLNQNYILCSMNI